jgi:hypothetical protein
MRAQVIRYPAGKRRSFSRIPTVFGKPWTKRIVTVGSGREYATLAAAVAVIAEPALYLITPGNYTSAAVTNFYYEAVIRGLGVTQDDVTISTGNSHAWLTAIGDTNTIVFENLKHQCDYTGWNEAVDCYSGNIFFNRCSLLSTSLSSLISGAGSGTYCSNIVVTNCYLSKGYTHIDHLNLSRIDLIKVQCNTTLDASWANSGSLRTNDCVTSATSGYGPTYGSWIVEGV